MRGHVQKRGGTWSYVLYLGRDPDGKKKYKWVGGHRTKREAEDALVSALERLRTGMWTDPGRTTVGEFLEQWLAATETRVRPNTARSYRQMVRDWVVPRAGSVLLANLNAAHLRTVAGELLAEGRGDGKGGLAPSSVLKCHRMLKHAFKDAVRWGLLPRNPMDLVDPPRVAQSESTVWSAPEARRFLDGIADDRLFAMWVLFLTTGMRRGEMAGLMWSDLDTERGVLVVQRAVVSAGRGTEVAEPKTRRSRRSLPLDEMTLAALKVHRRAQLAERLRAGEAWCDSGRMFTGIDGAPLHPDTISAAFAKIVRKADVPKIRLHDLRHTSATVAMEAGVHPKIVSERLGHSTIQITLDLYSHATPTLQADAADRIGAAMFGGG